MASAVAPLAGTAAARTAARAGPATRACADGEEGPDGGPPRPRFCAAVETAARAPIIEALEADPIARAEATDAERPPAGRAPAPRRAQVAWTAFRHAERGFEHTSRGDGSGRIPAHLGCGARRTAASAVEPARELAADGLPRWRTSAGRGRWPWAAAVVAWALAPPALAQSPSVDEGLVEACFAGAPVGETAPPCLGEASNACQARPGGSTTIGIAGCIGAETAAWDVILNREYGRTRTALAETSGGIDTAGALLDAQRAWIAYRDAECALTYARWQGGTIRSVAAANCGLVFTATRALELRDMRAGN